MIGSHILMTIQGIQLTLLGTCILLRNLFNLTPIRYPTPFVPISQAPQLLTPRPLLP